MGQHGVDITSVRRMTAYVGNALDVSDFVMTYCVEESWRVYTARVLPLRPLRARAGR